MARVVLRIVLPLSGLETDSNYVRRIGTGIREADGRLTCLTIKVRCTMNAHGN